VRPDTREGPRRARGGSRRVAVEKLADQQSGRAGLRRAAFLRVGLHFIHQSMESCLGESLAIFGDVSVGLLQFLEHLLGSCSQLSLHLGALEVGDLR
jgi:hypothetical protein